MRRFLKIALSVASVSAVTAAMAISASAAMSATYNAGTVTLTDVVGTGTSQTLLVLNEAKLETVVADNIKQIDQKDDGTSFSTVPVGELPAGTYEVRIGGDGTVQTAEFTVGPVGPVVKTKDITIGDVNEDTSLTPTDLTNIKRGAAGLAKGIGSYGKVYNKPDSEETYTVGDINVDKSLTPTDLTNIKRGAAGLAKGIGSYGQTVTVIDDAQ